jgi:hypothetical protein
MCTLLKTTQKEKPDDSTYATRSIELTIESIVGTPGTVRTFEVTI